MKKLRLLKLADLLEADASNRKGIKFDLKVIATKSDENKTIFVQGEEPPLDCGTMACAVGLACISGAFKKSGLSFDYDDNPAGIAPTYKHHRGFDMATQPFFGIDDDQCNFLFQPSHYPDSRKVGARAERFVAQRIREFVATDGANCKRHMQRRHGYAR